MDDVDLVGYRLQTGYVNKLGIDSEDVVRGIKKSVPPYAVLAEILRPREVSPDFGEQPASTSNAPRNGASSRKKAP